jgi:hypothetical protein
MVVKVRAMTINRIAVFAEPARTGSAPPAEASRPPASAIHEEDARDNITSKNNTDPALVTVDDNGKVAVVSMVHRPYNLSWRLHRPRAAGTRAGCLVTGNPKRGMEPRNGRSSPLIAPKPYRPPTTESRAYR